MSTGPGRKWKWPWGWAAIALMFVAGPAAAHHGWGSYDAERPITVTGPIVQVVYQNPHVHLKVETADKTWEVTLAPVSRMENRGATADLLPIGKTISAYGYPSRVHPDEMRAERITIDGRTFEMR